MTNERPCSLPECDNSLYSRGLCLNHYKQARRRGDFLSEEERSRICSLMNCEKWVGYPSDRFCSAHHFRMMTYSLSASQQEVLVSLFDGQCYICKAKAGTDIDHDHACCDRKGSCGKCVRGVLCGSCNRLLGVVGESVDRLNKLVARKPERAAIYSAAVTYLEAGAGRDRFAKLLSEAQVSEEAR